MNKFREQKVEIRPIDNLNKKFHLWYGCFGGFSRRKKWCDLL